MRKTLRSPACIISLFLLVFFCVLARCFPYTGDDLFWGTHHGISLLEEFFQGYNGRYLGNLLVLGLTRSKALDTVVMGLSFTAACWLCFRYAKESRPALLIFSALLFLLLPPPIFAQALVWTAGFANYVPSALICGLYLVLIRNITDSDAPAYPRHLSPGTFLLGFCGAFFLENVTVFNICLGVAVIGYTWLKFRRFYLPHLSFLMGGLVGAALLFINPCYHQIAQDTDFYRHVTQTAYETIIYCVKNANQMTDSLIYENTAFCLVLTLLTVTLAHRSSPSRFPGFLRVSLAAHILLLGSILFLHFYPEALYNIPCSLGLYPFLVDLFMALLAVAYLLTIIAVILLCVPRSRQFRMLMPLLCVPVVMAPLLVVNPIGPRCMFTGYFFLMLFTADFFSYVLSACIPEGAPKKRVLLAVFLLFVLQAAFLCHVFFSTLKWDTIRNDFAAYQSEQGASTIYMCDLPYPEYIHKSAPDRAYWMDYYKEYYGLNPQPPVVFVDAVELTAMIQSANLP